MTSNVRIIVKAVSERQPYIDYLKKNLPQAEFCMDEKRDAFDTWNRAMEMAGSEECVHMEEDVIITKNFYKKTSVFKISYNECCKSIDVIHLFGCCRTC